jgi:hypothetical protein
MNAMSDFRGLTMRISGLGGELINRVGGSATLLPAGNMAREYVESSDEFMRRLMRSDIASREDTMRFLRFNEQAFLKARTLNINILSMTG